MSLVRTGGAAVSGAPVPCLRRGTESSGAGGPRGGGRGAVSPQVQRFRAFAGKLARNDLGGAVFAQAAAALMARRSRLARTLSGVVLSLAFGLGAVAGETGVPPV